MNLWINQRAQGLFIEDNGRLLLGFLISLVDFFRIEISSFLQYFPVWFTLYTEIIYII